MSLRHGIYTPHGRSNAELLVAKYVAMPENAPNYVPDRIAHLGELATQIEAAQHLPRTEQIVGELDRAAESLGLYLAEIEGTH